MRHLAKVVSLSLFLMFANSCKDGKEDISDFPKEGVLSNIIELPINNTDSEEIQNYALFLDAQKSANLELRKLANNEKLEKITGGFIPYEKMLAMYIKESRLEADAKSRTGATGIAQLQSGTIETISKWLKSSGIPTTYNPKENPSDNIIYSVIYMSYLQNEVTKYIEGFELDMDDAEKKLFAIAAYNMGPNKWKALYTRANHPKTRDDFVKYIIKDLMKLSGKSSKKIDPSYGVEYLDYFGEKDFSKSEKVIFERKGTYYNTLTESKAQEVIRYGEIIKGLEKHLKQDQKDYSQIKITKNQLYNSVKDRLHEQENKVKLKEGSTGNRLIQKILLDNGYTMKGVGGDIVHAITVNESIIAPYLIDKSFLKYKYRVESYNKSENRYLRSIVNNLIEDRDFIQSLKGLDIDTEKADLSEEMSVIRQYALEVIVRFNKERRNNWEETASQDVWLPEKKYFHDYESFKAKKTILIKEEVKEQEQLVIESANEVVKVGKIYSDPKLDIIGNAIPKGPTKFGVSTIYNSILENAEKNNGRNLPKSITIHGTEGDVSKNIAGINAHFFIDWDGKIYQYTTSKDSKSKEMIYPDKIVALNHAGLGDTKYGFSWNGDKKGTYSSIGIEVASTETSRPNSAQLKALEMLIKGLCTHYNIPAYNVFTHQHIATSKMYGRGRKSDLFGLDFTKINLPNNYQLLDQDVVTGKVSPNMKAQVDVLKGRGMKKWEIKKVLSGLDASIRICRKDKSAWENRKNKIDINAWATLDELEKKDFF